MRGQAPFDSFGTILHTVAHRLGLETKLLELRLRRQWPQIVGDQIAAHTRPDQIRFKKLYVFVHHSVWLQQLSFLKPTLLEKINAAAGHQAVTDLVLRIGDFAAESKVPTEEAASDHSGDSSPDLLAEVAAHAQPLKDPELRSRLAGVMARALSQSRTSAKRPTP